MATYKRNKSGGTQSEGASNSASPASSVALSNHGSTQNINNNAPKYGTLVPNRIFVGGISSNTTETELCQLFSKYGNVKATKIIADRAGVSKGYGFVTFESEEEVKFLIQDANNIVLKERRLNIAPAIKKQPFSRSFETSSPPPATPNLYYSHNGVPYTFHNGMAFFPPTAHQPALAALPQPADPSMYPSYGPAQNGPPAPYGTPVLVPAPPPVFMPAQNYSYPMPMTNGAPTQFIYPGSGSSNSGSGSPLAGTPDNPHLPPPMPPQFYAPQFPTQDAFYPQPIYISYNTYNAGEYETHDQQLHNDDSISSTASTPHTEISERSSSRSPAMPKLQFTMVKNKIESPRSNTETPNIGQNVKPQMAQTNSDSQVPVVSWQNLKNNAEERQLHIRDGRRAFHPIVPPQPPTPRMMYYQQQPTFSNNYMTSNNAMYQQPNQMTSDNSRNQGQNFRGRTRYNMSANSIPFIPKFPDSFNNNNPLAMNNNFHEKKVIETNNGRSQRFMNSKVRNKGGRFRSPPSSIPKSTIPSPYPTSPSQVMPQSQHLERPYDRAIMAANTVQRWANNPPPVKRVVYSKRQNGSNPNVSATNNSNNIRLTKKPQACQESGDSDVGGGGDAQPILQLALTPPSTPSNAGTNSDVASKMQSLSLGNS